MSKMTRSLIQLPRGEVIDTAYLCAYSYGSGRLQLVMASGDRFECVMDEKRGNYWLNRLNAERGGASPAIAPGEQPAAEPAEELQPA